MMVITQTETAYHAQWVNTIHHWFIDQNSDSTLQAYWHMNEMTEIGVNWNVSKLIVVTYDVPFIVILRILKLHVNEMCYN